MEGSRRFITRIIEVEQGAAANAATPSFYTSVLKEPKFRRLSLLQPGIIYHGF